MAPHRAQPLDVRLVGGIAGDPPEIVKDILTPHLPQSPQEIPGVVQHDARITPLRNELGNNVPHAPIAISEGARIVIIAFIRVLEHVLEVRDQLPVMASRDRGLVHVKGDRKGGRNPV